MNHSLWRIFVSAILFGSLFLFGCSKPESRLIGEWEMVSYYVNGSKESDEIKVVWRFQSDGQFFQTISYPTSSSDEKGQWRLDMKKKVLIMDYAAKTSQVRWSVVTLEKKVLEVNYKIEGFFVEREFKKLVR